MILSLLSLNEEAGKSEKKSREKVDELILDCRYVNYNPRSVFANLVVSATTCKKTSTYFYLKFFVRITDSFCLIFLIEKRESKVLIFIVTHVFF